MAAKKKSDKGAAKKGPKGGRKKKVEAPKDPGTRGRKAVLVGCTPEQGKRFRRHLRAKGFMLSQLEDGDQLVVREVRGNHVAKHGKDEFSIPAQGKGD